MNLTPLELKVLRMLNGDIPFEWGAATSACLEHLEGCGYATRIPYTITEAGRTALKRAEQS